jgi:integrase
MNGPNNLAHARDSSTKAFDHEEEAMAISTLPNAGQPDSKPHSNQPLEYPQKRSVMWAAPALAGSRSESPPTRSVPASGVTGGEPAEAGSMLGAAVAGDVPRQRQPLAAAMDNIVIDDHSVDDAAFANERLFNADEEQSRALQESYAAVREARALIKAIDVERSRRQDTSPSDETIAQYQRRAERLDELAEAIDAPAQGSAMAAAIAAYSGNSRSFYLYRAAATWKSATRVRQLLKEQSDLQRSGERGWEWYSSIQQLRWNCERLREVRELTLDIARERTGARPARRKSKRDVLHHVDANWRERFLEVSATSDKYRAGCLLIALCGFRPRELELGLTVRRRGPMVAVKIGGAKVRPTAGQPWRGVFIPATRFPEWFLDDLGTETKVYGSSASGMRSYLYRLSSKVLPTLRNGQQLILSAYVLRHALATDLRREGWSAEEIAAVLGESSAQTARWYGLRKRGSKSATSEIAIVRGQVATARPVKPIDRTWLGRKSGPKLM